MRGRPLHPNPVVPGAVGSLSPRQHDPRTAVTGNGNGQAGAAGLGVLGAAVPQVTVDHQVARHIKTQVGKQLAQARKANPAMSPASQEQQARRWINDAVAVWSDAVAAERGVSPSAAEDAALARTVFDLLFRAGRLQPHLDNPRVENIFINGHEEVWLDFGGGRRERAEPVADSEEELLALLEDLARNSGQSERSLSTARPMLALRLPDGSRLQAFTGVSPKTYVTIRRHRVWDVDLDGLVKLGTLDTTLAQFLRACIRAEKNVMIAGEQAAGKTSLLRALLKEFDPDERFATVETEFELFAHTNSYHRQVIALEGRESNGERGPDGRGVGEITLLDLLHPALRMSLSRVVVGEVRGPEVVAMMQALTSGKGGNLCTLHARRPQVVFDRIAELYALADGNLSEQLAYRQIANGLDFIVYVSLIDETKTGGQRHRFVSHVLEVTGMGENGRPATNEIFAPAPEQGEPRAVPRMHPACSEDLRRAGFSPHLLDQPYGAWDQTLALKVGSL
ncbi:CpaF/VirB11 family protein [Streptomyces xinghaiensis]|uniref:CpaF family protein n=1 Tax=Streptomyces xinghaiensis TaxID=1038928 RepID=UPI000584AF86|nr:ATP/GTP-binding protein [Streptomyces sp. SID5475]